MAVAYTELRVHSSHAGHGIVGDLTYADDRLMYRMFLHAAALELPLALPPVHSPDAPLSVEAPLTWGHVFEAEEPTRCPEGWPHASALLDW